MFKLSSGNSRKTCSICPKSKIKTPKNVNNGNANIYLFKVNNRNGGKTCETCPELKTIKTPEQRQ